MPDLPLLNLITALSVMTQAFWRFNVETLSLFSIITLGQIIALMIVGL